MGPLNLMIDETGKFNELVKKYILNGMRDYPQCFITIMACNLMWTQDGELKILNLTNDQLGHLRIIHKDSIDDWVNGYLKWCNNTVEEQEMEGSGFVYNGWIGFHIEMFPLWTFVGYKHHTPSILEQSVVNPNIDYNMCLQRCLILVSDSGHKIIANCNMGDESVYNKWWKQPNKYKVLGVTIHEIEEAMDIRDSKPFEQSEKKFSRLVELLSISLSVFEITLLPGYDDNSKDKNEYFASSQIYSHHKSISLLSLVSFRIQIPSSKHFMYIKDLTGSNNASITKMLRRIEISQEARSAGSVASPNHKQLSKTMKYRYIEIR